MKAVGPIRRQPDFCLRNIIQCSDAVVGLEPRYWFVFTMAWNLVYQADARNLPRGASPSAFAPAVHATPSDRYQELFVDVQRERIFEDSKTFVDCVPRSEPEVILERYRRESAEPGFSLHDFVSAHFTVQDDPGDAYVSPQGRSLSDHIDGLWDILARSPGEREPLSSLLPLPCDYVVPGGRFAELYYWDSYFTMLGLSCSSRPQLLRAMLDNHAHLIETYGYVPNGTRTYYLSRSQPPVFALMVELCESHGICAPREFLPHLQREHAFWMEGAAGLRAGEVHRRVVALPDGTILNRYWDDRATPRDESWREDMATAAATDRPSEEVWRDLRAACESGWDFSSRWLDGRDLHSICTTRFVPVDLNALLHRLESLIARIAHESGEIRLGQHFDACAQRRREAIDTFCWDEARGAYVDYDWSRAVRCTQLTAATVVPLFVGIASEAQAAAVARTSRANLLAPGGFATTLDASGEQWDRPNGWAPVQWMAVKGFERYGHTTLAKSVRARWLRTVGEVYRHQHKVVEKYALREMSDELTADGRGGEYPVQQGFGWTNGVTRNWLEGRPAQNVCADDAEPLPDEDDTEPQNALPPALRNG